MVTPKKIHPNHWHITTWKLAKQRNALKPNKQNPDFGLTKMPMDSKSLDFMIFSKFLNISFHSGEFSQCLQEGRVASMPSKQEVNAPWRSRRVVGVEIWTYKCFRNGESSYKDITPQWFNKRVPTWNQLNVGPLFHWKGLFIQEKILQV